MAKRSGELGEPDYLSMISKLPSFVQQIFSYAGSSMEAKDTSKLGEHD